MASISSTNGETDQALVEEKFSVRIFTLNRPKQLNALLTDNYMLIISSVKFLSVSVSRLMELFIDCREDFAVKLLILKSYLHIWAPWIWCFLLPMLVPEARGTSLGFLLVCWQMLAFMIFYGWVVFSGQGRAFCAEGDVAAVVRDITLGNWRSGASYFRKEFTLNYVMATYYSKPQVSILNGIVMGGGAGACFCTCFLLYRKQHWDSSLTCLVLIENPIKR